MNTEERFDVVIYEKATRKIEVVVGTSLRKWDGTGTGRHTAESFERIARGRINEEFSVKIVTAGKHKEGDILP